MMFDHRHYVPLLKARKGELGALRVLTDAVKQHVTPLVEVQAVGKAFTQKQPKKSLDVHLRSQIEDLATGWTGMPVFLESIKIAGTPVSKGEAAGAYALEVARTAGLQAIPVTAPGRSAAEKQAVAAAVLKDGRGVCLRLAAVDFTNIATLKPKLTGLMVELGVVPKDVDLVLDFQDMAANHAPTLALGAATILRTLPDVELWRSLTVMSTAFPETLGSHKSGTIEMVPRSDWDFWKALVELRNQYPRVPAFGDYGIQHPDLPELDPRLLMKVMKATIRYTTGPGWLIVRGASLKDDGYDQFRVLSKKLIARPEYSGATFSWGDKYISECAAGTAKTGNQATWRKVGTAHHLTLVPAQIASLPGL